MSENGICAVEGLSPQYERIGNKVVLRMGDEISHEFTVERVVDTSSFNQGPADFVKEVDIQDLSQFPVMVQERMSLEKLSRRSSFIHSPTIKEELEQISTTGKMLPCSPEDLPDTVFHAGCSVFVDSTGEVVDKVAATKEKGFYGGMDRVSYFGISEHDALSHGLGNYNNVTERGTRLPDTRIVMATIDTSKLATKRNIFKDPESLLTLEDEYGRNFVVHHGIPASAIRRMEVLRYEGMSGT